MESTTQNNDINGIKEVREIFNEIRSNFSHKEIMEIREKLHKKENIYNFFKEKEQEDSLPNKEKNMLKNISRYLKKFKKDLEKLKKKTL